MDIQKSENHELVAGGGEGLTSFFIPGAIDSAFRENGWAVGEMVDVLTGIIRDDSVRVITRKDGTIIEEPIVTPREKMAAILMLDKKAREGMILGGLIMKDRLTIRKQLEDGSEAEYNSEGMRLAKEGSSRLQSTLALLEGAKEAQDDTIIDVEVLDGSRSVDGSDAAGGDGPVLTGQPRGSNSGEGSKWSDGGSGSRHDGSGGDEVRSEVHGKERASKAHSFREGNDNDEGPIGTADRKREAGVSLQHGGGGEDSGVGKQNGRDVGGNRSNSVPPKRPIIPGEAGAKRANWWKPGIPRRSPDSDSGSLRDCDTAESSFDRLKRIERARKQAAEAAASYTKERESNKRPTDLKPGDEPRSCN